MWSVAQLSVFVMIIGRMHYVLKDTKFELKEANYIIFTILIFVCVLLCILWILRSILYYDLYTKGNISQKGVHEFSVIFVIFVEIIDLIISIFFIVVFIKRLKLIINHHKFAPSAKLSDIRNKLLKYWVLSLFMIGFTQIIALILCLLFITDYVGASVANNIFVNIYGICLPLNPMISAICIFLMFQTYHEYYDKRCGCCDNRAMRCFDKMSENKAKYKLTSGSLNQSLLSAKSRAHSSDNKL